MPTFRERVSAALTAWKKGTAGNQFIIPRNRPPTQSQIVRSYSGAQYDRLTEDWMAPLTTGDAEMKTRMRIIRGRARELERNEPYSRRFLSRLVDNVYDHHGMAFSSLAGMWKKDGNNRPVFQLDASDAWVIEQAYNEWRKNPTVTGDMTLNEAGRLMLRTTARDGDPILRFVVDSSINDFGFALQLMEPDMIDDYKNEVIRATGRPGLQSQIRMGVEVDAYFRATAYWLLTCHPGDQQWWAATGYNSERHEAKDYLHTFFRTRITQVRDVTWLCGIMRDLKMLDGYDEAAIVAARVGAAKMGFLTRDINAPGEGFAGDSKTDPALGGNKSMDAEPGLIEDLSQSPGLKFEQWDPAYPHDQYDSFVKTRLRRIGAGLDMSYYAIANDLTEVNFSSIRAGLLEDREAFKAKQTWWIDRFETPIFLKWLEISLLNGSLKDPRTSVSLPFAKIEKFKNHRFRPRRWPWVDPEKDANAAAIAVDNRFKSRNEVIQETSQTSFAEVIAEQAREQELAEQAKVGLPPTARADKGEPKPDEGEDKDNSEKTPQKGKEQAANKALEARMQTLETKAQPIPQNINITMPGSAPVNVSVPAAQVQPTFNVTLPENRQAPPVVNVTMPEQKRAEPPVINVNVPKSEPVVNVNLPPMEANIAIKRDGEGFITSAKIT
jgi:lambda family phage portal protein